MNITFREAGDITVAEIIGSLDTSTSAQAESLILEMIDNGARKLLIDFEQLDFISSAGLRILLGIAKRLTREEGLLRLANMNDTVKEVFSISGFDSIIQSSSTTAEALQAMA